MLDKIKGIRIKGRCFKEYTDFLFFQKPNDRISIVYGKNGSGKSTISEGVSSIIHRDISSTLTAEFIDADRHELSFIDAPRVFVFNEKYIDENVKIDDDGLGAIVLIGGQVDLQAEIDLQEAAVKKTTEEMLRLQAECDKYEDKKSPLSPYYHWGKIESFLKQDGNWADVDSVIKGKKIKSSVSDAVIDEICGLPVNESFVELQKKYNETRMLLEKVSLNSTMYPNKVECIDLEPAFETKIVDLLAVKIEEPILTEREKLILAAIQNGEQQNIESARKTFSLENTKYCPYCYQSVSDAYKNGLTESISRVLNKDVDIHKTELAKIQFPMLETEIAQFEAIDPELANRASDQLQVCRSLIEQYRNLISEKIGNIYTPIVIAPQNLYIQIEKLNSILKVLEEKRVEFNNAIKRKDSLKQELLSLNKSIAHVQTKQLYKDYRKQQKEKQETNTRLRNQQDILALQNGNLDKLKQQKSSIGLAIDSINNALDYVFLAKGRLSIELQNRKYYLKSKGEYVKPKNVSQGERNIIALCYFFTQIMANQEISELYSNEAFVVIDDPVSSFDFENKVGITSFLRYQANRLIKGNQHSKILFLSHDLETIFALGKAMDEICKSTKGIAGTSETSRISLELCKTEMKSLSENHSEYGSLLKKVYHYANGEAPDEGLVIGNIMRRVLEAFSTFIYQKGINEVSYDKNILAALGDRSKYFENLMYRLVLHGESHYKEQIFSLHDDVNFYQFISETEKIKTAKNVLCFMFILNPYHLHAYFQSEAGAIKNIEKWVKDIQENQSFEIMKLRPKKRIIPLYFLPLSAGLGKDSFEGVSYDDFETENEECDFALKISGDSMEPMIPDGSIALIRKKKTIDDGKAGAFYLNGKVYCKYLMHKDGNTFLCSFNDSYNPIQIKESDEVSCYGELVEVIQ